MTTPQKYRPLTVGRSIRLDVRGVNYHLVEWGDARKPLLFMLHGWGDCAASFQFVVDALKEDWFVVAPDWRGFGQSETLADCYWFPDYLADLDIMLAKYSPNQPVNLLGHSMGANVAGLYAGIFPERVGALVNVEGFGLTDSDPQKTPENYRRWISGLQETQTYSTYSSFAELADRIRKRAPRISDDRALYVAEHWAAPDRGTRITLKASPAHKLPNAVLYRRAEALACWEKIAAPTLVIVGGKSAFSAGAELFPHDRLVTLEQSGHMLHFEQPTEVAAEVESFLRNNMRKVV